ncbi:MAG: hypothetical protein KUG77_04995 [Nannocystaceae bacterium]|nr:hypothetical protein [Nannocystaceae bacterium]
MPLLAKILLITLPGAGCQDDPKAQNDAVYLSQSEVPAPVDDENKLSLYVAQCEAVLGKIPAISCDPANPAPGTHVTRIPVFVDGYLLGFGGDRDEEEFARRAANDDYTCDFPSIGGDFPCSVGSTLVQYENEDNPNVQWVGLCRGVSEDNPGYDRFIGNGLIGANTVTGEMCFFFAANDDEDAPYVLPKLSSDVTSEAELGQWLPPRDMPGSCLSCHPNNDPWVMTPWLQPSYMAQVLTNDDYPLELPDGVALDDIFAARFIRQTDARYKTLLPEPLPKGRTAWTEEEILGDDGELLRRQYRAVGSSYVANEAAGTVKNRSGIKDPAWEVDFRKRLRLQPSDTSCAAACHAVANAHFDRMAKDSFGEKYANKYLSDSMREAGTVGGTWMPPGGGSAEPWRSMFEGSKATVPAITECPIPKRLETPASVSVHCASSDDSEPGAFLDVQWSYLNDYGDVPGRDDIRFDVAITVTPGSELLGLASNGAPEGIRMEAGAANTVVIRDVAPVSKGGSEYALEVPISDDDVVRVEVQPKRFCFEEPDRHPFAFAQPDVIEVDVDCE